MTVIHTFRQSYRCMDRQKDSDTYIQAVIQMCGQTDGH